MANPDLVVEKLEKELNNINKLAGLIMEDIKRIKTNMLPEVKEAITEKQ